MLVLVLYWGHHSARRMIVLASNAGVVAVPMYPPDPNERLSLVMDQRDAELFIAMMMNFSAREHAHEGDILEAMRELHNVRHLTAGIMDCDEHLYITKADLVEIHEDVDKRLSRLLDACVAFALPWQERRRQSRLASPPVVQPPTGEGR